MMSHDVAEPHLCLGDEEGFSGLADLHLERGDLVIQIYVNLFAQSQRGQRAKKGGGMRNQAVESDEQV
jgi:hypothetical protein